MIRAQVTLVRPFGRLKFLNLEEPVTSWLSNTPTLHPYGSTCGIDQAENKLSKIAGISASYPMYCKYNELT